LHPPSHTNPWPACEADAENHVVRNSLLLSALWDAFDRGLVSVANDGAPLISGRPTPKPTPASTPAMTQASHARKSSVRICIADFPADGR
jgi:hypothetical protein